MTGFYLYFAITKREFSLGSWRERIIEVTSHSRDDIALPMTLLLQEKKKRLYDKNDFPIAECVHCVRINTYTGSSL